MRDPLARTYRTLRFVSGLDIMPDHQPELALTTRPLAYQRRIVEPLCAPPHGAVVSRAGSGSVVSIDTILCVIGFLSKFSAFLMLEIAFGNAILEAQ